ncbi:response regulator [bacterium]|nr:response regulator [bacterium]MBU1652525.1 response regulator [bacterium]
MARLLIADDDPGFLVSLSIALRREGHEVHAAENSEEALNLLDKHPVDCMLIDIRLGPLLGVELAEWARLRKPDLPVIFISAYAFSDLESRIRRITDLPILEKPFEVEKVNQILSEPVHLRD